MEYRHPKPILSNAFKIKTKLPPGPTPVSTTTSGLNTRIEALE